MNNAVCFIMYKQYQLYYTDCFPGEVGTRVTDGKYVSVLLCVFRAFVVK